MYSTHLEFHRQGDDLPATVWLLLFWTKVQDNRTAVFLSVFLSRRPPPYVPFSEIWSYRPAAVASACMQCIQFDDRTSRFVCLSVVWLIGYENAAFLHGSWKLKVIQYAEAHGHRAAGREFDDISEANVRLWRRQKATLAALPRS